MDDHSRTPLFDALIRHQKYRSLSFHVPGHKNGAVFAAKGKKVFEPLLSIDLTELSGLDDLHQPSSVIKEAQQLLSSFYHTDQSWFLVGGSTAGNLAMIQAVCDRGDVVLVQRNCHQSVIHGIRLAGVTPVYLAPRVDQVTMLATTPPLETVKKALQQYPEAKALILMNPNYYGMTVNLASIIDQAHAADMSVLVDEAHGAHFVLGSPFPASALEYGADVVVQSAHKTLPAMTMGAYIHLQGSRVRQEAIKEALNLLQSSSPSYPILASLDLARSYMEELKSSDIYGIVDDIRCFREMLSQFPHFSVVEGSLEACDTLDPLKVTLQSRCSLSGFEMASRFEREGIYTELADPLHVLFIAPLARFQIGDLVKKMNRALAGVKPGNVPKLPDASDIPIICMPEQVGKADKKKLVPLEEAVHCIAAQEITPYPPGIPVIVSGERISASQISNIQQWDEVGGRFQTGGETNKKGIVVVDHI